MRRLEEVLKAAYPPVGKGRYPKASDLPALKNALSLAPGVLAERLVAAAGDLLLERTRGLAMFCLDRLGDSSTGVAVTGFVRQVLQAHPAFQDEELQRILRHEGEFADIEAAVAAMAMRDFAHPSLKRPDIRLNKHDASVCKANALTTLMLWAFEARGLGLARVLRLLHGDVWPKTSKRDRTERRRLWRLLAVRDGSAPALVYDLLQQQCADSRAEAVSARVGEQRVRDSVVALEATLGDVKASLTAAQTRIQELEGLLATERSAREDDRVHLRDDYENLRGRLLGRLRSEVNLLEEGLVALRRDPPKVNVMLDHAERAVDGLRREIQQLKEHE